jgi:hypothetical protein
MSLSFTTYSYRATAMPLSGALQADLGIRLSDYNIRVYILGFDSITINTDSVGIISDVPNLINHELSIDSYRQYSGFKRFFEPIHSQILTNIDKLLQYEDPPISDISHAKEIIKEFALYINIDLYSIDTPFVHINEDNCVSIEWRKNGKTLYFEIENQIAEFTKVWRDGKKTIARSGILNKNNYKEVWEWLIDE